MNSGRNISFAFVLMLFLQVVICQVFQFGSYCVISLLPAMLICLPTSMSTLKCMLSAFFIALFVDFFGDGLLGLNAFSLLPLAYARNFIFTKLFNFVECLTLDVIYFTLAMNTVELLSVHPLMLKTLLTHQGDALITAINTVKTVFSVGLAGHYLLLLTVTVRPNRMWHSHCRPNAVQ